MTQSAINEASLLNEIEKFGIDHIRPRRFELITSTSFPKDLWQRFSESGLAGLSCPLEFGGLGASFETLSSAGQILNQTGGVPGATMSLMGHWLFSKLHIASDASEGLQRELFPALINGTSTLSVAISEPGAGAHPKFLKTTARRDGNEFVLNGEKSFLTNGPLADFFIVLSITEEKATRKAFSAILVPASSVGFERTEGAKIDFLHPCPHGGIRLENCRVPVTNLIGVEGDAFEKTSLRMRAMEDAIGAAGQVGAMACLLEDILPTLSHEKAEEIGALHTQLQALKIIATELSKRAEEEDKNLLELQAGFRQLSERTESSLSALLEGKKNVLNPETLLLAQDISKLQSIAKSAHKARLEKIGRAILHQIDL